MLAGSRYPQFFRQELGKRENPVIMSHRDKRNTVVLRKERKRMWEAHEQRMDEVKKINELQ